MMKATPTKGAIVWMVVLLLIALLSQATPPAHAEDSHVKGTMILPSKEEFAVPIGGERAVMASGAAEDTLNACKARIPELASAGQHLLAEQSCVGAEQTRNEIRSAPKF
ncbi:MAG TPA: hypothetical protein VLC51_00395 [Nitrospira sp.]|nr:hypothetical protein [Nitrospira sp.]